MLAVLGVKAMFSTANNVLNMLHQLHELSFAGLVVILEIAADYFTDRIHRDYYLDIFIQQI